MRGENARPNAPGRAFFCRRSAFAAGKRALPLAPRRGLCYNMGMRLDKFLKVSRIIKRRTVAAQACDDGRAEINGRPAKPSARLKVGDAVTLHFGDKLFSFRVLSLNENARKEEAASLYEVIDED